MSKSTMLIAYEINGSKAKDLIVRNAGFVSRLKKFQNRKLVDHVSSAWQSLEAIFHQNGHEFQNKLLYTTKDTNSLSIGTTYSDLINNSYIMSLLAEKDVSNQRYFSFQDESEFEKQQFSLILDQAGTTLNEQEIGVFGWFMCPEDQVDRLLKQVAISFSGSYGGELHFFEFTNSGKIYPNFSDVSSQRFEGKLAGNYQMVLDASEYKRGIEALNEITLAVFRTQVVQTTSQPEQKMPQAEEEIRKVTKSKNTYSDDFKEQVARAALEDGKTLAAIGEQFGVHPTLVRTWKINLEAKVQEEQSGNIADTETTYKKIDSEKSDELINSLNSFKLEGHIDHDKDLSVRIIFDENEKRSSELVVLQGTATLSSNKETLDADVFESFNLDGYSGTTTGYLKLEEDCDPEFSISLKAEVYRLEKYQVIEIDTSDKNALKGIELSELTNFKIDKFKITFDDDNYIEVKGEIILKDSNVYAISLESEAPDEDPYFSPEMAENGKVDLDQGVWGAEKGAKIYLVAAQFEKISEEVGLDGSGFAEISDPVEDDVEGYSDGDETSDQLFVNVAYIQIDEIIAELEVDGFLKTKNKITRKIESFRDGICESVDGDSQFFLHDDKGNVHSIQNKDALKPILNKEKSSTFQNIIDKYDQLKISFTAHGANHWEDGFLTASAMGVQNVYIWGFYPAIDDYAVQGYRDGDFDTGIAADPDSGDFYANDDKRSFYGITDSDFELSTYGLQQSGPPEIENISTEAGAVGQFEFQIKRGLVDEDNIDDEELQELVDELKNLCDDGDNQAACELLLPNLSFEFDPSQLDDDPEQFFSDTNYIELECNDSNTSVKVGNDDGLTVTIAVKFEIPLNEGISTTELSEYLPESGAWSAASVSPGWGYAASDGDNVWFIGLKLDTYTPAASSQRNPDPVQSISNNMELDFSKLGDEPYNWYYNMLNKFEDYDLAEEKFTECVDNFLNDSGISDLSWSELRAHQIKSLLNHIETVDNYKNPDFDEKVNGPLHSLIHNSWFTASENEESQPQQEKKDIREISKQTVGSDEFKIEVASACAESGMDFREFAKKYDLDPQQLNSWATNFLGTSFDP